MYSGDRRDITVEVQLCISINVIMETMLDISYYIAVSWYRFFLSRLYSYKPVYINCTIMKLVLIYQDNSREEKKKKKVGHRIHHSSFIILH